MILEHNAVSVWWPSFYARTSSRYLFSMVWSHVVHIIFQCQVKIRCSFRLC